MLKKLLLSTLAVLSFTVPAVASVTLVPGASNIVAPNNDFRAQLASVGVNAFSTLGSNLLVGAEGVHISFDFFGSESGFNDVFKAGSLTKTETTSFTAWNPVFIGQQYFAPGSLIGNLNFTSPPHGRSATVGEIGFGIAQTSSNTFWLLYDDQFHGDKDYDDMIVRATVTSVPEPATWMSLLFGFGILGYTLRNNKAFQANLI